jgi:cobalt-zinc-cadmium efflux system outer membrane protein
VSPGRALAAAALAAWAGGGAARALAAPPPAPPAHLTKEQAVALALAENPGLLAQGQAVTSTRAGEITAGLRPNPTVANETQDFTAGLSWPLELGGKRRRRLASARLATSVAESDFADARRTLTLAVRQTFDAILLAKSNLALAVDNLTNFQQVEDLDRTRYEKGAISGGDLLRIQLQKLQFQTDLEDATLALTTAQTSLKGLLAAPEPGAALDIEGELRFADFARPLADLEALAIARRPDLASAERARQRARADARLAEANRVADLSLTLGWSHTGPPLASSSFQPFYPAGETANTFGTGISVPLRLFDRNQGEIARTRSEVVRADELAAQVRNQVIQDVEVAYRSLATRRERVRLYADVYLPKSRQSRQIAELAFRRGATSILDLLDAERGERAVELAYRQALADYVSTLDQLDAAVGEDVAR